MREQVSDTDDLQSTERRDSWGDAARGFCMLLVVLMHLVVHDALVSPGAAPIVTWIDDFFRPIRMPAFFVISGYYASKAIRRPLVQTKHRTIGMFYLSALWTLLLLGPWLLPVPWEREALAPVDVALAAVLPGPYWFLWALATYFLIARLVRHIPVRRVLPVLLIMSGVGPLVEAQMAGSEANLASVNAGAVLTNLVWFYAGINGQAVWDALRAGASWGKFSRWAGIYVVAWAVFWSMDMLEPCKILLTPVALGAAANLSALCRYNSRVALWLAWVGRGTLPVYLLHPFVVMAMRSVLGNLGFAIPGIWHGLLATVALLVVSIAVISVCRMGGDALRRLTPTRWLFELPQPMAKT